MFNKPEKYFGLNDTYNVFTKEYVPLAISNRKYNIPSTVNIQGEEWVSVNVGYIQLQNTLATEYQLEILDTNGRVLQSLTLKESAVGVDIKPTESECIWFNENGLRGNYYINSKWLGKVFNIKRGLYVGTAVGADYFNNIYERNNIIRDKQEHFAGYYYDGKPVYYRSFLFNRNFNIGRHTFISNVSRFNIDFKHYFYYTYMAANEVNVWYYSGNYNNSGTYYITLAYLRTEDNFKIDTYGTDRTLLSFEIFYTKTTDSRIL